VFGLPLHILIVHFPIALATIALAYDAWGVYAKRTDLHRIGYGLTMWAAVGALAALATGLQLAQLVRDKAAVTGHAGLAIGATILLVGLGGVRYSAQAQERKEFQLWWLLLEVAAAGLVCATAITGHLL
jgi:uncharacterized membrane protein